MTARVNTITVVLENEKRTDDCEHIINAISMIKGVLTAKQDVADTLDYMATSRAKREICNKLFDVLAA